VIDATSGSIGGKSERFDATSGISAAMTRLAGANEQRGPSIATNGGGTRRLGLSIEKQARAIATKALGIERSRRTRSAHPSVNEALE
jgi:hypothetical protein